MNDEELKQIEYEQVCEDWRHRDSMLWQSLAVAITLTGAVFGLVFRDAGGVEVNWMPIFFLFLMASILNWVLLLKISKDHYYQLGSNELLEEELGGKRLAAKYDWRIHEPSERFFKKQIQENRIPFPCLYKCLTKLSAFKWFFRIQLFLLILTLISVFLILSYYIFSLFGIIKAK